LKALGFPGAFLFFWVLLCYEACSPAFLAGEYDASLRRTNIYLPARTFPPQKTSHTTKAQFIRAASQIWTKAFFREGLKIPYQKRTTEEL
jgi:hypothetical protein